MKLKKGDNPIHKKPFDIFLKNLSTIIAKIAKIKVKIWQILEFLKENSQTRIPLKNLRILEFPI